MAEPVTEAGRALVKWGESAWEANLAHNIAVVERQARAALLAELQAKVEALEWMQEQPITTLAGHDRPPRTPADYVENYRAAVLEAMEAMQRALGS